MLRILFLSSLMLFASQRVVKFERAKVVIGGKTLQVELAERPKQHARGLMFRKSLGPNEGMLFVFPTERPQSFWMKNTFIPLSIGYFDKNRKLLEIIDMEPAKSEMETNLPRYRSRAPARFALEVNQGWFKRNKIKLGTEFTLVRKAKP